MFTKIIGTDNVIDIFEQFRHSLRVQGDYDHEKELADMIQMLDSPLFKQIITVQDSIQELDYKIRKTDQIENEDFDFTATGELSWFRQGKFPKSFGIFEIFRKKVKKQHYPNIPFIDNFFFGYIKSGGNPGMLIP